MYAVWLLFLCLQSCVAPSVSHLIISCPQGIPQERVQYLTELCKQSGMERVKITSEADIQKIEATKRFEDVSTAWDTTYREYAWVLYVRRDSVIAFATQRLFQDGQLFATRHFNDTARQEHLWYWRVRDGLDSLCGASVQFVLHTARDEDADMYYRDLTDSLITRFTPLADVLRTVKPDTSEETALSATLERRIAFGENNDTWQWQRSFWELDQTAISMLRLLDERHSFDMMRLYQTSLDSCILETRQFGMNSTLKRYLISNAMADAIHRSVSLSLERARFQNRTTYSEQLLAPRRRYVDGETLIDMFGIHALLGQIIREPAPQLNQNSASPTDWLTEYNNRQARRLAVSIMGLISGGVATIWSMNAPWATQSSTVAVMDAAFWGVPQGMALYGLFGSETEPNLWAMHTAGFGLSIVRSFLTARLPEQLHLNFAQTQAIQGAGVSGMMTGLLLPVAFGALNPVLNPSNRESLPLRLWSASTLIGSLAGYGLGYYVATQTERPLTGGNGYVFDAMSKFGMVAPLAYGFGRLFSGELTHSELQTLAGVSLLAQAGGYALSAALLRTHDFSYNQEISIRAAAGGATLLPALTMLTAALVGKSVEAFAWMPAVSSVGWMIGFTASLLTELPAARENFFLTSEQRLHARLSRASASYSSVFSSPAFSWMEEWAAKTTVDFSPLGLVGLAAPALLPVGVCLPIARFTVKL